MVPAWARQGCVGPKLVTVPPGRTLYAAGGATKGVMAWGAFEEVDVGWYLAGHQLDPRWYAADAADRVALYEYEVLIEVPTPAVMSRVADQPGAPARVGPPKFQCYTPAGLGTPRRGRLLGYLTSGGTFTPADQES